jgi:putative ABC transport system permease protein
VIVARFDRGPGHTDVELRTFEATLLARLAALPGVSSVATAPCPPLAGACEVVGVNQIDDATPVGPGEMSSVLAYEVSPEYFRTLGVPLVEGRAFDATSSESDAPLAVVDQRAAEELFGGDALGHRLAVTHELTEDRSAEIIGVVANVRAGALEGEALPTVYFARRQAPRAYGTLLVQTTGAPEDRINEVRAAVRQLDPNLALADVTTLADLSAAATARTRVLLALLTAFSLLGLSLSAVGIYGMVSYDVQGRARELGLRVALGASAASVLRSTVGRPTLLVSGGAAVGLAGALLLTRQLQALLFDVEPRDPRVLATAAAVLIAIGLGAALLPARRALRVDPAETLRGE